MNSSSVLPSMNILDQYISDDFDFMNLIYD